MNASTILMPVAASERIEAMDVLRGFALLGILLMNTEGLSGPLFASLSGLDPALSGADRWADGLIYLFVQGKFYPLFSLLFGMGFAVMITRAQAAGRAFTGLYLRRTLGLLVIGVAHAALVWSGDILTTYALLAFALLLFRDTPQSRLPKWGTALYLLPLGLIGLVGLVGSLMQLEPSAAAALDEVTAEQARVMTEQIAAQRQAYGSGSYLDAVAQRLQDFTVVLGNILMMGWQILGLFLWGAWFVRSGAIARPREFPRLYAGLRWVALPVGLAMTLVSFRLLPVDTFDRMDLPWAVAKDLHLLGGVLMGLGYLAWVLRALDAAVLATGLRLLAPAGRMALSNYLLQSIVCTLVFSGYGLGYFEQLSRAWQVPFALVFFALQVVLSHWWLARFRHGPAEWAWRSFTYLRTPPLRIGARAAA
ncbi:DUF418 domain-containing protein [Lysobacter sp. D1-1-M9]|uniref:DUF418 domain-containing protein n=1 Tax=Novilysobacter longmucuonensis TaxID=3098603 RepID=UPI002FC74CFC